MTDLKQFTNMVIYIGLVATLICAFVIIRNKQQFTNEMQFRQLGMTYPIDQKKIVKPMVSVDEPIENLSGDNISQSVSTGVVDSVWRLVLIDNTNIRSLQPVSAIECHANQWGGCDSTSVTARWVQSEESASVFAMMFIVKKSDLITLSGDFRTNGNDIQIFQGLATGGWQTVGQTILNTSILVDHLVDSSIPVSHFARQTQNLLYSFSLEPGQYFFAVYITSSSFQNAAIWFSGTLAGTLVQNIMMV